LCPACKEPVGAAVALAAAQAAADAGAEMHENPRTMQLPAIRLPLPADAAPLHEVEGEASVTVQLATDTGASDTASKPHARDGATKAPTPLPPPPRPAERTTSPPRPDRPLRPGDHVLGRYTIVEARGRGRLGAHFRAEVSGTGDARSVWVLRAPDALAARAEPLRESLLKLAHASIARTEAFVADAGRVIAVTEPIDGDHLAEHLARRGDRAGGIPVRNALASVAQLAGAVASAQPTLPHGALDLDAAFMDRAGRLKLVGFGLGLVAREGADVDREMVIRDDVSGLCRMLHALLVGSPWTPSAPPAHKARADVSPELGTLLQRGLRGQIGSAAELHRALVEAIRTTGPATGERAIATSDDARWMIVRGQLDYGPYAMADLLQEVESGKLTPEAIVKNAATGVRGPVTSFPALRPVLEAHARHQKLLAERAEEAKRLAQARRYKLRRMLLTGSLVLVTAGGVLALLLWRMQVPDAVRNLESALAADAPIPARTEAEEARLTVARAKAQRPDDDEPSGNSSGKRRRKRSAATSAAASTSTPDPAAATSGATGAPIAPALPMAPPEEPPPPAEVDFADNNDPSVAEGRARAKAEVRRGSASLRTCFDREGRNPAVHGRFVVSFMVSTAGRVYRVRLDGARKTPHLEACVRAAVARLNFPQFQGTHLEVQYPFTISHNR
jgi:hypothetical protein